MTDTPEGLSAPGAALWLDVMGTYELAAHEAVILLEAAWTVDLSAALQESIVANGAVMSWGDGTRANPAAVEARQQRITLARLIASLGIPAHDEARKTERRGARGVYQMAIA